MISEIVEVLAELAEGINKKYSLEEFSIHFGIEKKYDKKTVAAAYSWIHEKFLKDVGFEEEARFLESSGMRVLNAVELSTLGLNNYNHLLHYYNIGLISLDDFEMILSQLLAFPEIGISTDRINVMILGLFLDIDDFTLPGSRVLLYSSDTIN
jgi:uncharacterized protein Smg (DUF494 family)